LIMPTRSRRVGISNLKSQILDPSCRSRAEMFHAGDLQFPGNPLTTSPRQMMVSFPFLQRAR
jgi:hypothetical protein